MTPKSLSADRQALKGTCGDGLHKNGFNGKRIF